MIFDILRGWVPVPELPGNKKLKSYDVWPPKSLFFSVEFQTEQKLKNYNLGGQKALCS